MPDVPGQKIPAHHRNTLPIKACRHVAVSTDRRSQEATCSRKQSFPVGSYSPCYQKNKEFPLPRPTRIQPSHYIFHAGFSVLSPGNMPPLPWQKSPRSTVSPGLQYSRPNPEKEVLYPWPTPFRTWTCHSPYIPR